MEYINDLVSEVTKRFNYELEKVVRNKLFDLRELSFQQKDYKLYEILTNINFYISNPTSVKKILEENGYELFLERPEFSNINIDFDKMNFTYDLSQVKLKVKKVVFEV